MSDEEARFAVLGHTGNVYDVTLAREPRCTCVDFRMRRARGTGVCKHILFVYIRVLRLDRNDSRVWQNALLSSELSGIMERVGQVAQIAPTHVLADLEVRKGYSEATGLPMEGAQPEHVIHRKEIIGERCPVCYEDFQANEEARNLLAYCQTCGGNYHSECISACQRVERQGFRCPLCRSPWKRLTATQTRVQPGGVLPSPPKTPAKPRRSRYLNLAALSSEHQHHGA